MNDTNDESIHKLKTAVCDYYMSYIKHKFKTLLSNGKEEEIYSHIMQFLDAQIDTGNNNIVKDDISHILYSALSSGDFDLDYDKISSCFPEIR